MRISGGFRPKREPLLLDILGGAAAGALASWTMGPTIKGVSKLLPEKKSGGGDPATVKTAQRALRLFGVELSDEKKPLAGQLVHYGYGSMWGALYGALWPRSKLLGRLFGVGFGLGLFLASDELMVPALKLSKPPQKMPWTAHAKGLAGHLAYGITADNAFRVLRRAWA